MQTLTFKLRDKTQFQCPNERIQFIHYDLNISFKSLFGRKTSYIIIKNKIFYQELCFISQFKCDNDDDDDSDDDDDDDGDGDDDVLYYIFYFFYFLNYEIVFFPISYSKVPHISVFGWNCRRLSAHVHDSSIRTIIIILAAMEGNTLRWNEFSINPSWISIKLSYSMENMQIL